MRLGLLTAAAVLTLGIYAGPAYAGGVVIDFRELGMVAEDTTAAPEVLEGELPARRPETAEPSRQPRGTGGGDIDLTKPHPDTSRDTVLRMAERERQIELQQLILAGLVTEEEAASGCGATAAAGPAGLAPLAVAVAALFRTRRKGRAASRNP